MKYIMAKKDKKNTEASGPVKMTAPKQNKDTKVEEIKSTSVPMPVKKVDTKSIKNEEKIQAKSERKAEKKEAHDAKPLHFHFFRLVFGLLIFGLTTVVMGVCGLLLYNGGTTDHFIASDGMEALILGLIIMVSFAIWMSEFQVGYRRLFRIGRYERIRKAEAKKAKKIEKYKAKHADRI